jgi:hypothetical protein
MKMGGRDLASVTQGVAVATWVCRAAVDLRLARNDSAPREAAGFQRRNGPRMKAPATPLEPMGAAAPQNRFPGSALDLRRISLKH